MKNAVHSWMKIINNKNKILYSQSKTTTTNTWFQGILGLNTRKWGEELGEENNEGN
jgi:hypothetical protein